MRAAYKVHAPENLSDVLQVCIAILPIHNNTEKLRNNVLDMQKIPISKRGQTVSENTTIVTLDTLLLRYYMKVLFCQDVKIMS